MIKKQHVVIETLATFYICKYTLVTPWPLECEFFAIISLTVAFIKILRTRYEVQLLISHLLARSIGYVNL